MAYILRKTYATERVIGYLLECNGETWGLEISKACELAPGTVYLILDRLTSFGWLNWRWDDGAAPGPRRKLYSITPAGRPRLQAEVSDPQSNKKHPLKGKSAFPYELKPE
jgi:DNA-binding PadR family transcriptional regulator